MSTGGVNFENFFKKIVNQANSNKTQTPAENLQQTANNLRTGNNFTEGGLIFNTNSQPNFNDGNKIEKNIFIENLNSYGFNEKNSNTIYNILNLDNEEGISAEEYQIALDLFGQDTDAEEGNDIVDIEGIASKLEDYAETMSEDGINLDVFIAQLGKDFSLAPYSKQGIINELIKTGLIDKDGKIISTQTYLNSPLELMNIDKNSSLSDNSTEIEEESNAYTSTYTEDGCFKQTLEDGSIVTSYCGDAYVLEKDGKKTYVIDGKEVTEEKYNKIIQIESHDSEDGKLTIVKKNGEVVNEILVNGNTIKETYYGDDARIVTSKLNDEGRIRIKEISAGNTTTTVEYDANGHMKSRTSVTKNNEGQVIAELYTDKERRIEAEISDDGKVRTESEYSLDILGNKTLKYTRTMTQLDDGSNIDELVYPDGKKITTTRNSKGEIESITELTPKNNENGEWLEITKDKDGNVLKEETITKEAESSDSASNDGTTGDTEKSEEAKEPQTIYTDDGKKQQTTSDGTIITYDCNSAYVYEKDGKKTYVIDDQEVTEEDYNKRIKVTTKDLANGGKETEVVKDGAIVSQVTIVDNKTTETLYKEGKITSVSVKTLNNDNKIISEEITEGNTTTKIAYNSNGEIEETFTTIKDDDGNVINELYVTNEKIIASEISPDGKKRTEEEYRIDKDGNQTLNYTRTITKFDDGSSIEELVYTDGKEITTTKNSKGEIESITELIPKNNENGEWLEITKDKNGNVLETDTITRETKTSDSASNDGATGDVENSDDKEVENNGSATNDNSDAGNADDVTDDSDNSADNTGDMADESNNSAITEDDLLKQATSDNGKLSATFENSRVKDKIQTDSEGNEYITVESWNSDGENGLDCASRIIYNIYGVSYNSPEGQVIYKALCEANPDTMDPNNPDLLIDDARINLVEFTDKVIESATEETSTEETSTDQTKADKKEDIDTDEKNEENEELELTYTDSELEGLKKEQFSEIIKMIDDRNGGTGNFVENNGEIFYDSNNDTKADMRFIETEDGGLLIDTDNDGDYDAHVVRNKEKGSYTEGYASEITLKTSDENDADIKYVRKGNEIFKDTDLENKNLMLIDSDKDGKYDTAVEFDGSNKVKEKHSLKDYNILANNYFKDESEDEEEDVKNEKDKSVNEADKTSTEKETTAKEKEDSEVNLKDNTVDEADKTSTENKEDTEENYEPTEEDLAILNSNGISYDITNASEYVKMMKNNQVRDFANIIDDIFNAYNNPNENVQLKYDNEKGHFSVCFEPNNDTAKIYTAFKTGDYEYKMNLLGDDSIKDTIIELNEDGTPQKITFLDMEINENEKGEQVGTSTGNQISYEIDPENENQIIVCTTYDGKTVTQKIPKEKDEV